mmetsp:Transcript_4711/g.11079  ORF Transcript_4711/g.11079 Transcript_4711/m.11079 type:complete len:229 (+) Transcript_4711:137-823(+)
MIKTEFGERKGEEFSCLLDVYKPKTDTEDLLPGILFVHGGGFYQGGREHVVEQVQYYAKRGWFVVSIEYRLVGQAPYIPKDIRSALIKCVANRESLSGEKLEFKQKQYGAAFAAARDTKNALRYFRANAKKYGCDPDNIAIYGESAGAVLALDVGLALPEDYAIPEDSNDFKLETHKGTSEKMKAIVAFNGAPILIEALSEFDGKNRYAKKAPPTLVIVGKRDKVYRR